MDNLPWTKKRFRKSDRQLRPHCGRNRIKIIVCWPYLSKTCYWGTSWVTLSDIFIDSVRALSFLLLFLQYCLKSNFPYLLHQKRGCVISLWRTLFVFFLFPRYGIEKIVFIYNKAQTFTSSGFVFPQKMCIFAENLLKYGKGTNKIWNSARIELFS